MVARREVEGDDSHVVLLLHKVSAAPRRERCGVELLGDFGVRPRRTKNLRRGTMALLLVLRVDQRRVLVIGWRTPAMSCA